MAKKRKKKSSNLRMAIQIFFFVLIAFIAVNHTLHEKGRAIPVISSASLHAVCPFGGVVSLYQYFTSGTYIKKIHSSSFILMWIVFGLTVLVGPVFCGWVCPFGSFQELIGKIGKKIFKKKFNKFIPYSIDKYLRFLRYIMLAWVLYATAISGKIMFDTIDPYYALFHFWSGEVAMSGFIVLGITIILTLFVARPFCKYACPFGATLGIFNLFRFFSIKRNIKTCIDCKACDRECQMNIQVSQNKKIWNHQCITCMKCTSEAYCPVEKTVELSSGTLVPYR
jgi:polyferredoxin